MTKTSADLMGAAWLACTYEVMPLGRLHVVSQIDEQCATQVNAEFLLETYPAAMRPAAEPAAHLQFHLKHEIPHLEFLARLFERSGPNFLQIWIDAEPSSQYARRAAFLYEWLTDQSLVVPKQLGGNYVDAIDDAKVVAASADYCIEVQRWRVNDNLPGTRYFCPMVVKTEDVKRGAGLNAPSLFEKLTEEFGKKMVAGEAENLALLESKASFAIEGEGNKVCRIQCFADVMTRRIGKSELPLTGTSLGELQRDILGNRTVNTHFGVRQSPVFVGETVRYQEVVHYVAPAADEMLAMLDGLQVFLEKTQGQSAVMRSAVTAFGFVYIHPLADGNGRVHRFLINEILRRDGVLPDPIILPISALIADDLDERMGYEKLLGQVSMPLMQAVRDYVAFDPVQTTYPDGVVSNFVFHGAKLATPIWRYPDLGPHVVFLARIIGRSLTEQMPKQYRHMRSQERMREALKEVVKMTDQQADRVLRSFKQNCGVLSNVLAKEIPAMRQAVVWDQVVEAISRISREEESAD